MKKLVLVLLLCLALTATAMSIKIDDDGNMVRVVQREVTTEDGRSVTIIFLEWGNLEDKPSVGFCSFNGFIAPELGRCKVVATEMFDSGGSYDRGTADKIRVDGPNYVAWKASTVGKTDGLTVRIVTESDTKVHIKVGEWHGTFDISAGEVVKNSLSESSKPYSTSVSVDSPTTELMSD